MNETNWLAACKREGCLHEWEVPGGKPPAPGTRCSMCLRFKVVAYQPGKSGMSPKNKAAREAKRLEEQACEEELTREELSRNRHG